MNCLSAEEEFSENLQEGRLAQLGERLVYTQEVGGSIRGADWKQGAKRCVARAVNGCFRAGSRRVPIEPNTSHADSGTYWSAIAFEHTTGGSDDRVYPTRRDVEMLA